MTEPSSLEPSIALAAYAEPLASNRRVLVFGNALGALCLQLLERGARSVHVCDSDALRVSEATARNRSTQVSFSSLADSDLALRDGAFDLALVDNLGAFNAASLVRTAKRAVGSRGAAIIACPNSEAAFPLLRANNPSGTSLDYYALYDAVAAEFEHVRMLGQTPFVGYAIADFSASGEPEPALDTSFVPGGAEEPDSFIALASGHEVKLDEFAVIQLPTRRLLRSAAQAPAPAPAPAPSTSAESLAQGKARDGELARLNQWIKELESRASTADERADHAETELEELRPKLDAEQKAHAGLRAQHDKEVSALRAELSALRTQSSNLRGEASALRAEASTRQGDFDSRASEIARLTAEVNRVTAELLLRDQQLLVRDQKLAEQSTRLAEQSTQLAERNTRLAEQSTQLAERNARLAEQSAQLTEVRTQLEHAGSSELGEFERQLAERGAEIRGLEQQLRTAERTGRELVHELTRRQGEAESRGNAELERALSEREADLQAAAWTIESLSLRLELAGKSSNNEAPSAENATAAQEAR